MAVIILDSNILVYLSKGLLKAEDVFQQPKKYCISVISYIELLSYQHLTTSEVSFLTRLYKKLNIIYLDEALAEETIRIRKTYKLKLPDAVIAATASINNALLISNDKDFQKITEIQVQTIS